jgi:hypothetical protein
MSDEPSYSASWREAGTDCHVSASKYGVNFSWSTGPGPNDGWGESYTWERWFAEGKAQGGGPSDLLTRIEAVGRTLGFAPKPAAKPRHRRREDNAGERDAQQKRYLRALRQKAAHSTPETLIISRRQFEKLRKLALQRAQILWELLCPGTPVKRGHPTLVQEGTRLRRSTDFSPGDSGPGYTLLETEDRFEGDDGVSVWYALRVQCVLGDNRQFGIWFVDGNWQLEIIVGDEATVYRLGDALRQAHPEWAKDPTLCGAVRAFAESETSRTMFNRCFGHTGPTRLAEQHGDQLWPITRPKGDKRAARDARLPALRLWSPKVKRILGFAFDADAALQRLAIESGLHWVVPIGTTTSQCWLGLRRLPELPLERCPVLLCHGANAATVATELRDALPMLVWWLGPRGDRQQTNALRENWALVEDHLAACAEGIGGAAAMTRLRQWLDAERDPSLDQPANSLACLAASARIMGTLDPGQKSYRNHVVALSETPEMSLQWGIDAVGAAWQQALLALAYSARVADPERAWALAGALPSLDLAGRLGVSHQLNVKVETALPTLAASVALRQPRSGALATALQAINEAKAAGKAYDGTAHIEAAARASIDGHHEGAWRLLAAAGYWSARANRKADPVIFEGARAVAKQAGYGELTTA